MFCSSLMAGGSHDRNQMPVLLAGRLGGGLRTGRTLTFDKAPDGERRLCNLFADLAGRYGLEDVNFGDSTGRLRGL
jgi:hypothetical protein